MSKDTAEIIRHIGETDQQYLEGNTYELAIKRANFRLDLVMLSSIKAEQIHFLQEAIVLLEQGRIEFEEALTAAEYVDLSLYLAKAYMMYFEITHETRFALITQQILKPLAHLNHADLYFFLAYASVSKKELALTRHWLKKYTSHSMHDLQLMQVHPAFNIFHHEQWFITLLKSKVH